MRDAHFEPFLHLAGLAHDRALIAWGGFFFRAPDRDDQDWHIVPDPDLDAVTQGRRATIGADSRPYGPAEIEVVEERSGRVAARASTREANHVRVTGLEPDTTYRYRVTVDGEPWAAGPRLDWLDASSPGGRDLRGGGREYDPRFTTFPHPDRGAPVRFAVLGDYGAGVLAADGKGDRQRRLAAALERAVEHAGVRFVVTTGDNIYLGDHDTVAGTGNHDDDWYFSFYEPYRYAIARVPVFPGVGNHDSSDSEVSDDRALLAANFYTDLRFGDDGEVDRASVDPGLFYRFRYGADLELVAIDTTLASELEERHYLDHPRHRRFLEESFPAVGDDGSRPRWRIPFSHHPPYCAGPSHPNAEHLIEGLVPLLQRSNVRLMLSGHEHNFQHSHVDGIDYLITGAAGKLRETPPDRFGEAGTVSWAAEGHLLLVDVEGDHLRVHPVTDVDETGAFTYLDARDPTGRPVELPIRIPSTG